LSKTALIVDDSKSARVVLKRLLESHELDVDTAESAEAALDYLIDHRPDVIFMDHMMPGMDGFEAVTAIKNNPDTATIPIMMYTSQEGELYVGQARALGAVGVLPKQVEPVEVSKVLRSLRVIGDETERRKADGSAEPTDSGEYPGLEKMDKELRLMIQGLFDQQRAVLRRDLLDSYEAIATRVADEIRPKQAPEAEEPEIEPDESDHIPGRFKIATIILSVLVAVFASLYWQREQSWQDVLVENTALRNAIQQGNSSYAAGASEIQKRIDAYQSSLGSAYSAALASIEWGVNQAAQYSFDELPFGDKRLRIIEDMSDRLLEIGFVGLVKMDSHVGEFCMLSVGQGNYALPQADLDAAQCDAIGFGAAESVDLGLRQSVAFANFINVSSARTQGRIRFEIASLGTSDPAVPYPASLTGLDAASWNKVAAANNRVVVTLIPEQSQAP
jgi:CheY-like chemotaxis protein